MTVPAEKLKKMAESERRRERERRAAVAGRVVLALAEVERLVGEFRALDPAIEKIVLFGSLARKDVTSLGFDIDLAAADDRIKASIARDGVVLHEK